MNIRLLAVKTITPLLNDHGALQYNLKKQLEKCPEPQKALLQQLCYGSMRYYPQLELLIDQLLGKPLKKKDNDIRAILLLGVYQLYQMRTPAHAVVSETVDLCKLVKKSWACSLVNACLRNYQRSEDSLINNLQENLSFKYNHPDWLLQKLKHNWPNHWQLILQANDCHPPLTIRVNTHLVSRETLQSDLSEAGFETSLTKLSQQGLTFNQPTDITQVEHFQQGNISVQDEAAQLAATLVSAKSGERILDACSAPGGKLLHLLELTTELNVEIQALELEPKRAEKIQENLSRLEKQCTVMIGDAAENSWWDGKPYDKILLDAPCSASGVIRRNPDIKLLRKAEDIHSLSKLQLKIINNLWSMLSPEGKLIYATCSVFPQENEKVCASFSKENSDAIHIPIEENWGESRPIGRQLFPKEKGNDGFYYAVFQKKTTGN